MSPCQLAGVVCANGQETGMTSLLSVEEHSGDWTGFTLRLMQRGRKLVQRKQKCVARSRGSRCRVLFFLYYFFPYRVCLCVMSKDMHVRLIGDSKSALDERWINSLKH